MYIHDVALSKLIECYIVRVLYVYALFVHVCMCMHFLCMFVCIGKPSTVLIDQSDILSVFEKVAMLDVGCACACVLCVRA